MNYNLVINGVKFHALPTLILKEKEKHVHVGLVFELTRFRTSKNLVTWIITWLSITVDYIKIIQLLMVWALTIKTFHLYSSGQWSQCLRQQIYMICLWRAYTWVSEWQYIHFTYTCISNWVQKTSHRLYCLREGKWTRKTDSNSFQHHQDEEPWSQTSQFKKQLPLLVVRLIFK